MLRTFSLIAACDQEMGIGKGGTLPWRLPGELEYFHRVTSDVTDSTKKNAVVMGRKTWESIPEKRRPLPGRLNCVITRQADYTLPEGVLRFGSLDDCLGYLSCHPVPDTGSRNKNKQKFFLFSFLDSRLRGNDNLEIENIFIIGGAQLFTEAIKRPECTRIYLTRVEGVFDCDTFFPEIPEIFRLVNSSDDQEENGFKYKFLCYQI